MKKMLYIATVPSNDCLPIAKKTWEILINMKLDIQILGIQYDNDNWITINAPQDLKLQPSVNDYDVMNALAKKMYCKGFASHKFGINTDGFEEYISLDATTFGLAIDGCGRVNAQLGAYPHIRIADGRNSDKAIRRQRECFNINAMSVSGGQKYNANPMKIAKSVVTMMDTKFDTFNPKFKEQIINAHRKSSDFTNWHLKQIGINR